MKKDFFWLLLLILPAISWLMQPGYFTMHDDLQSMRQYQLDKCFKDYQIPCRWVPDMGYGYGYPLFNYYPPLPYLIGQPFRLLNLQYIDIVKLVGILGFGICAINMYLLGKEFWGRTGGLISAAFYTYAPYHSVDFYVRGAMNEFWAMAFYPLIFWTTYRLIKTGVRYWIVGVGVSVACLMLSHNPMLMIFAPVLIIWCLFWLIRFRSSFTTYVSLAFSAVLALCLAAFFTIPVLLEAKFAHVESIVVGYFNYLAHFADLNQLFFNINWGYGPSLLGPKDGMSFALGFLHWIVPTIVLVSLPFVKQLKDHKFTILFLAMCVLGSLFMAHSKSTFIWKLIPPIQYLQFPWRFMTLAAFSASFLAGAFALLTKNKLILSCSLTLLLLLNANYFHPDKWFPTMTDQEKFSGKSWQALITASIFDYLPISAKLPPPDQAGDDINIFGQGSFTRISKKSNLQHYRVNIDSLPTTIELQTFYFPGWKIWLDGKEVTVDHTSDKLLGRMQLTVSPGSHDLVARFTDTPIRILSNLVSLGAVLCLVYFLVKRI